MMAVGPRPMKSSTTEDGTDSSRVIIQACRTIRDSFVEYEAGQQDSPKADSVREACLQEVRQTVSRQIVKDADYNLLRLRDWTAEVSSTIGMDLSKQALVADLLDRIRAGRDFLTDTDASVSSRVEEQCWLALQQFYIDGLDLAEYLHSCREKGVVPRSPKVLNGGGIRRREILGISSYSWIRTATLAMDVAVPNWTQMRFCRSMLPTLVHLLWHQLVPWGPLCWCDFERTTLGWLRPDGFARLRGQRGNIAEFQRREIVDDNPQLFDRQTRKTHHNVILVGAHRLGFLDFPFWTEMFRRTDHAVWANNAFYGPGMAKKLARGRTTVPIRGVGRMPLEQALDRSISILAEDRMPLFIIADGSQPNMMYGDQKRVKRGLRLLVDECVRQTSFEGTPNLRYSHHL